MRGFTFVLLAVIAVIGITVTTTTPNAAAQVSVEIGPAPDCPYGYYDVAPYTCAPPGYYGPEWFAEGVFIGAGPWFHGPAEFRGHVDNRFHPDHGFKGHMPERGEKPEEAKRVNNTKFKGNEMRDGRGHVVNERQKR